MSKIFFAIVASFWIFLVKKNFGGGDWYSDDSYFRSIPAFSLFDIIKILFNPTDDSGYYRAMQKILFSLAQVFLPATFGSYQWITIGLLLLSAYVLMGIVTRLHQSWEIALLAASFFLFNAIHYKPLSWINQWYHGSSLLFCLLALHFRLRLAVGNQLNWRYKSWQRFWSCLFWFFAIASNNGVHSFALMLVAIDFCFQEQSFLNRAKSSLDIVLFTFVLFAWIYLLHNPFDRAQMANLKSLNLPEIGFAFADYVKSSLIHLDGDSRTTLWLFGTNLSFLLGLFLFFLSIAFAIFDRKNLYLPLGYIASAFVISLYYQRWFIEYAAPVVIPTSLLLSKVLSPLKRPYENISKSLRIALGVFSLPLILLFFQNKMQTEAVPFRDFFQKREIAQKNFLGNIMQLDRNLPIGMPIVIHNFDTLLRDAPALHYFNFSLNLLYERRLVLLRSDDYLSGEALYLNGIDDPLTLGYLIKGNGLLAYDCNANRCKPCEELY